MDYNNQTKAIVVGDSHHNTLGLIRSLGEAHVPVYAVLLDCSRSFVESSRYLQGCYYCRSDADALSELIKTVFGAEEKLVLIPSCDTAALLLSKVKEPAFFIGGIDTQGGIEYFMNKQHLCKKAAEVGTAVPETTVLELREETPKEKAFAQALREKAIEFPVIIKPLLSVLGNKEQICVLHNREEAASAVSDLPLGKYLIQTFIHVEQELGIQGVSCVRENRVEIPGVVYKKRQSVYAPGSTTYASLSKHFGEINVSKIKELILSIGYSGIFDVELMYGNGKYYLVEINFRNGAYGYAYTKFGYNLAYAWYQACTTGRLPSCENAQLKNRKLMNETADFGNVLKHKVPLGKWMWELFSAEVKLLWNWGDIKPFFAKLFVKAHG